jgi:DNA polymerase III alpha subunit
MNEISPPNVDSPRIGQAYVELAAASNFSFLRGASHAEELVVQASRLGLGGIAITDRNSLAGVVRGHMAAKEAGLAFATGCRLVFMDGTPDILVWPEDRAAWGNLCELLTTGKTPRAQGRMPSDARGSAHPWPGPADGRRRACRCRRSAA